MARTRNYRSKRRSKRRSKIQTKHRNNTRRGGVRRKFRRNRRTRKGGNFFRNMFNKGKSYAGEYGQDVSAAAQGVSAAAQGAASGISNRSKSVAKRISARGKSMKKGINTMREKSQARSKARSERANTYANCEEAKRQTAQAKKMYDNAVAQCGVESKLQDIYTNRQLQHDEVCTNPMERNDNQAPLLREYSPPARTDGYHSLDNE